MRKGALSKMWLVKCRRTNYLREIKDALLLVFSSCFTGKQRVQKKKKTSSNVATIFGNERAYIAFVSGEQPVGLRTSIRYKDTMAQSEPHREATLRVDISDRVIGWVQRVKKFLFEPFSIVFSYPSV